MNALLGGFLTLAMLEAGVSGGYLYLMGLVILTAILNILIFSLGRRLLDGICGIVSICIAAILNLCSLIGVITGLCQYGLPEAPIATIAVILWLIATIITLPTLFIVRKQAITTVNAVPVTCPNCGTEIQH